MTAHTDYAAAYPFGLPPRGRLLGALRYALVLAVWLGLLVVQPRLALQIFRERRQDSPLPRLR